MVGNIRVEYSEADIRELILRDLQEKMPGVEVREEEINIEVKSAQNYRAEWERAQFRGVVTVQRDRDKFRL